MKGIQEDHPERGETMVMAYLKGCGVHIPRARMRASIHRVNPEGVAYRKSVATPRVENKVPGPHLLVLAASFAMSMCGNHVLGAVARSARTACWAVPPPPPPPPPPPQSSLAGKEAPSASTTTAPGGPSCSLCTPGPPPPPVVLTSPLSLLVLMCSACPASFCLGWRRREQDWAYRYGGGE
jgi:hypothetical protein